ncbi:MAG: riboflavin synthase [Gemmatimonadetes bacterium]|nr:riboflavin synthase [Gemmatimonadota bacterium]
MFTGIVEEVGRVRSAEPTTDGLRLELACERLLDGLALGDSIALDGVCQTVVALTPGGFVVEAIATTLSRTTLGGFAPGRRVNLERSLALGARLGGHLVQGHVDGIGEVVRIERAGEHVLLDVRIPAVVAEVTVLHGSVALNGVSLTVNRLPAPDVLQVALIPYTWEHTNLADLVPGSPVNLEGDMIGRFVVHYLKRRGTGGVQGAEGS